jgi:hypothetical protein
MCNLYSITTNQAPIIALFRVMNQYVGRCRRLADQQCREGAGEAHQQDARSYYDDQID